MATVNEKMTALADEIRELSGTTGKKGLDAMTADINDANIEVNDQASEISRIRTLLATKAAHSGTDTSDATAIASNILSGKTAYAKGVKVTGTMPNNGAINQMIAPGGSYTIPAGYHDGLGKVTASSGGGVSNDIVYVRVKAESPVTDAIVHYTAPDGNVLTIIIDNLEGDWQEFEAAAGSTIYIDSYAYLTYSDLPVCATSGNNIHFFFVQEALGPDDYHEIIFDEL